VAMQRRRHVRHWAMPSSSTAGKRPVEEPIYDC
jgi:hypothetical protein